MRENLIIYGVISISVLSAVACHAGQDRAATPPPLASARSPAAVPPEQFPKLFLDAIPDRYRIDFELLGKIHPHEHTGTASDLPDHFLQEWHTANAGQNTVASADMAYQTIHPTVDPTAVRPLTEPPHSIPPTRLITLLVAAFLSLIGWVLIALRSAKQPRPAHSSLK
jgi:hypothetical protein